MCKRMRPSKVNFDCPQNVATRSEVTHIAFDPVGVLVATATGDGLIRIYDFDDFLRLECIEHTDAPILCKPVSAMSATYERRTANRELN